MSDRIGVLKVDCASSARIIGGLSGQMSARASAMMKKAKSLYILKRPYRRASELKIFIYEDSKYTGWAEKICTYNFILLKCAGYTGLQNDGPQNQKWI